LFAIHRSLTTIHCFQGMSFGRPYNFLVHQDNLEFKKEESVV